MNSHRETVDRIHTFALWLQLGLLEPQASQPETFLGEI